MPKKEAKTNTFIYKGISAKDKKDRLAKYEASIFPPSPRGRTDPYRPDVWDHDDEKESKRKQAADWKKKQLVEYKKGLDAADLLTSYADARAPGGRIVFEKGKQVEVPEIHFLTERLLAQSKDDGRVDAIFELVEKPEPKKPADPKA